MSGRTVRFSVEWFDAAAVKYESHFDDNLTITFRRALVWAVSDEVQSGPFKNCEASS
jgi:hypothetical protein